MTIKKLFSVITLFFMVQCANKTETHTPQFLDSCNYKNAISVLDKYIKYDSLNYLYYKYKGLIYNKLNIPDSAILNLVFANSDFKKRRKVDAEIYYELGVSFDLKKSDDCAKGMFYIAYYNDSTNLKYIKTLAEKYYYMDDYKRAMTYVNKSLSIDSSDAHSYFLQGSIYYNESLYDKALTSINKGLKYSPYEAWAYLSKGLVYYALDDFYEAYRSFSFAILLKPNVADFYQQRAYTLLASGFPKLALKDCQKVIELDSTFAEVYHLKAIIYTKYYDKNMGCQLYEKYKKMNLNFHQDTIFRYCD